MKNNEEKPTYAVEYRKGDKWNERKGAMYKYMDIYYKDIGSRKGLTIAESDVEYTGSTATAKTVYRNKAITDIRKLVTEGYIKINRDTQNVSITTEKANL